MNRFKSILFLLVTVLLTLPVRAQHNEQKDEAINIPEIVLEHLADAYQWHIASFEGKHISIPLPVILRSSQTGYWYFTDVENLPEGFYVNHEAHGKIYEKMADGTSVRPLDLSLTKSVVQIWIVVIVMLVVFLSCARWYKRHDEKSSAPRGFVGCMEMLIMAIYDGVIINCVGKKQGPKYAPYLLTVFFFILTQTYLDYSLFSQEEPM